MRLSTALSRFLKDRHCHDCNARSVRWYDRTLKLLLVGLKAHRVTKLETVRPAHLLNYLEDLRTREPPLSPVTIRKRMTALRTFFKWCAREKLRRTDPSARVPVPKAGKRLPKAPGPAHLRKLLAGDLTALERACLYLMLDTGLRLAEVCGLELADVDLPRGVALVRHGKGDHERLVVFERETRTALRQWLKVRAPARKGEKAFFLNGHGQRFTPVRLYKRVKKAARRAGLEKEISPHKLRHGFATLYLDGKDAKPYNAQEQLGHRSITTTMQYYAAAVEKRRREHARLSPVKRVLRAKRQRIRVKEVRSE